MPIFSGEYGEKKRILRLDFIYRLMNKRTDKPLNTSEMDFFKCKTYHIQYAQLDEILVQFCELKLRNTFKL